MTAIALIAALAPSLIDLIAGLVHKAAPVAETVHGPSTGPVKFAEVFGSVVALLTRAAGTGQIPKELPPDETIKAVIQAVVSSMKLSGLLMSSVTIGPAPAQSLVLKAGQSVTIKVEG